MGRRVSSREAALRVIEKNSFSLPEGVRGVIRADFHLHSLFSDGKNSPEEVVLAAIGKGMTAIGFSDHSWTPFDESYCMKRERISDYMLEIARLKRKYRGRIKIFCGIEQDYFAGLPAGGFDYVIGSVHYVKVRGEYLPVDHDVRILREGIDRLLGGDSDAFAEAYFELVAGVAEKTGADLIGHFDLASKFSEKGGPVNTRSPRYDAAWRAAADSLIPSGKLFEINTGAVSRGYRTSAYPSAEQREYIAARGGRFIMSSDSHRAENLMFGFNTLT
ncbi:MAG: histidinol-phosphatase [Clostridia bacterium]|nr:histidinol-phosphatase [Clostridia bacterium]